MNKKIIGLIVFLVVIIGVAIGVLAYQNSDSVKLKKQLDLGNRYLIEENFERAIVEFTVAIQIDPQCPEAYLGLADAYIGMGDYESAKSALEKGIEALNNAGDTDGASQLQKKLDDQDISDKKVEDTPLDDGIEENENIEDLEEKQEEVIEEPTLGFEELEVKGSFMEVGVPYNYVTVNGNPDYPTVCIFQLKITDYEKFESDSKHAYKDGYEWRKVTYYLYDDGSNYEARFAWGFCINQCYENYYDIDGYDGSTKWNEEGCVFPLHWNNQYYPDCTIEIHPRDYSKSDSEAGSLYGTDGVTRVTGEVYYQVPVGYDGCVMGFFDGAIQWEEGQHINDIADDNTLFFRLN